MTASLYQQEETRCQHCKTRLVLFHDYLSLTDTVNHLMAFMAIVYEAINFLCLFLNAASQYTEKIRWSDLFGA